MVYAQKHRERIIQLVLTSDKSQRQIADENGVGLSTIHKWLRESRNTQGDSAVSEKAKRPQDWSAAERLQAVIETALLKDEEKNAWCRTNGVYSHLLDEWKQAFEMSTSSVSKGKRSPLVNKLQKQICSLEKDLNRKEKALAEGCIR